jgi:FG-GAP-like repeat/Right handed beta helix region
MSIQQSVSAGRSMAKSRRSSKKTGPSYRPCLERLEDRSLPSVFTVTSTADSGAGSLRAELAAAHLGDTIIFALPNPSTITLTSGTLSVATSLHISGPGAAALTITGNMTFPIFTVHSGPTTIAGLTLSNGGGANGGGVLNSTTLTLDNCVITGNQVAQITGDGGGIDNMASLTVNNCTISNNQAANGGGIYAAGNSTTTIAGSTISGNSTSAASSSGGGIDAAGSTMTLTGCTITMNRVFADVEMNLAAGGGIANTGTLFIDDSSVASNSVNGGSSLGVGDGGGIYSTGPLTILDSGISDNTALGGGGFGGEGLAGGIEADNSTTIIDSTIADNQATGGGDPGGNAIGGAGRISATFTLSNCTISGNTATGGFGFSGTGGTAYAGGLDIGLAGGQTGTIINCTIAGNNAIGGSVNGTINGASYGGGIYASTIPTMQNTIVATNHAGTDADIDGSFTSAVCDLIGDGTGSGITNGTSGNQVGTTASPINPKLGPLANYGGPTETQNLLPGSPAIDAGTNQGVQTSTDQRGYPRIYNSTVDIGAYEFQPFHFLAVSADLGGGPEVRVYDEVTGTLRLRFDAYEPTFTGGVRVAVADINGDGVPDIITAPGGVQVTLVNVNGALEPQFNFTDGRAPEIKVFSGVDGSKIDDFLAYPSSFTAGMFVAVADVNGDGKPDIITGPEATGQSGHTNVRVFFNNHLINTGAALTPDLEFNAYNPGFGGGVRVAAADFNGDGFADIVTSPGIWSGPDVRIFDGQTLTKTGNTSMIGEFLAYDPRYFGGVFVSTGDLNSDGLPDIITGTNGNGGPEVKAFSGANVLSSPTPTIIDDFFAYSPAFNGGARVAVINLNGQEDIVTGAGPGGGPHVRIFDGATGLQLTDPQDSFYAFDVLFSGGVFVGAT